MDSRKSESRNERWRDGGIKVIYTDGFDHPYDNPLLADRINYPPDIFAIDHIAYENFRGDLTDEEATLLELMIDTKNNGERFRKVGEEIEN